MATEGAVALKLTGLKASADLSAKQFYFVKMSGAGTVDVCSAITDLPCGVLQNKPTSGMPAEIIAIGETKVSSDAALTAGNLIGTSADGQAAAYSAAAASTKYIVGFVKDTTTAVNGLASAVVDCVSMPHGGV